MKHADKIMNTQKFKDVLLSAEGIIKQYRSSDCERSIAKGIPCLLYTSPSPRDRQKSRMPSSA